MVKKSIMYKNTKIGLELTLGRLLLLRAKAELLVKTRTRLTDSALSARLNYEGYDRRSWRVSGFSTVVLSIWRRRPEQSRAQPQALRILRLILRSARNTVRICKEACPVTIAQLCTYARVRTSLKLTKMLSWKNVNKLVLAKI